MSDAIPHRPIIGYDRKTALSLFGEEPFIPAPAGARSQTPSFATTNVAASVSHSVNDPGASLMNGHVRVGTPSESASANDVTDSVTLFGVSWRKALTWVLVAAAGYLIFRFFRKRK